MYEFEGRGPFVEGVGGGLEKLAATPTLPYDREVIIEIRQVSDYAIAFFGPEGIWAYQCRIICVWGTYTRIQQRNLSHSAVVRDFSQ